MTTHVSPSTPFEPERLATLSPGKRALFELLRRHAEANHHAAAPRRDPREPAPLSFGQERLWFLDQLEPGNPFYNVAISTRIAGDLDARLLAAALHAVIARHDALRTVFRTVAGRPEQVVCEKINFQLAQEDLSSLGAETRNEALVGATNAEAIRPFDLARGPLVRARLVRLARDEHVLLLTLHHIICDGWSMAVLRQEVAQQYEAFRAGRACELAPLPVQFADHAIHERDEASGSAAAADLEYWRVQLADLPGPLALPLDRPRPTMQTYRGQTCRRRLSGPIVEDLRRLAAEEKGTLCMVLLAAFQVLLASNAREHDVCVGMPIAGRTSPELERLIGFFVNTLVIRGRLDEKLSFRDFLSQLRGTMLAAYEHQGLPFSRLVEELVPERDLSRNPLVQVMFVLQNIPIVTRQVAGLTIADNSFDHAPVSNFDLTFNIDEHPDRLDLSLVYNPDLFAATTIERMLDAYQTLVSAVIDDRDCSVFELPVMSAAEQTKQLADWNATQAPFPTDQGIQELFVEQALRTPAAIALRFERQEMTYEELDRRSNRLGRHLIECGATVDMPVGVCLARSPELIVAILAILKSGAAYLPIDPLYPQGRRAAMIADSRVRLIVSDSEVASCLPTGEHRIVRLDADAAAIAGQSDAQLERIAGPENIAYIIYTSGSTGEPKGVEVAHRGLVNHAIELARRCDLQVGDSLLQYLSLSFDAAAEEIFPTLISGAMLQLHPAPAELSGRVLLEWSRDQGVNVLHLPVVVWTSLADEIAYFGGELAKHLKTVIVGGDSLPVEQVKRWREAIGDECRFLFAYGVTEATITSTLFDPAEGLPATASSCLPIGRPIANTLLYVLDEFLRPQPVGVAGELFIGGAGVARGYLDRAALTTERFVPNPFAIERGERMYRTGDLVRYLADGNVEFLGRVDRQVKVHGHRIEPAEIEAVLQLHPQVREAIVVPCGTGAAKRLAAYVGHGSDGRPSADALHGFLASRLPSPMLPAAIVVVSTLPRLSCAKVDVSALPLPTWERGAAIADFAVPTSEIESLLAKIWGEVLGRDRVGIHDNFFDIGGDSIRSIQVVARLGAAGWRITPKQLFQNQTIAGLARVAEAGPAIVAPQEPIVGPVQTIPIQHEFLSLATVDPHHHNQAVMMAVAPQATPEIIDRALEMLVVHHDALRTRFVLSSDGSWEQSIAAPVEGAPLEIVDLSALDTLEQTRAIERTAAAVQASLNLERGPLVRFVYFKLRAERPARLLATIHHLVVDAVSWRILLADLDTLCHQMVAQLPAQLPAKTTPVTEWSRRLQKLADADELRGELDFWLAMGAPGKPLPRERREGTNLYASGEVVRLVLDTATTEGLLGDAQTAYRARTHEILLAMLVQVLRDYIGGGAIRINLESHGREDLFADVNLSRTVGWFTSLYPALFRVPASGSAGAHLRAVKEQCRAIPTGGLGYGLMRWLSSDAGTRKKLAAIRQPEICFNYLGNLDNSLSADAWFSLATESVGPVVSLRAPRRHLWEIIAFVRDAQLHIEWHYSRAAHHEATIKRLAEKLLAGLRSLVEADAEGEAASPSDFPLAGVDQADLDALHQLLADE